MISHNRTTNRPTEPPTGTPRRPRTLTTTGSFRQRSGKPTSIGAETLVRLGAQWPQVPLTRSGISHNVAFAAAPARMAAAVAKAMAARRRPRQPPPLHLSRETVFFRGGGAWVARQVVHALLSFFLPPRGRCARWHRAPRHTPSCSSGAPQPFPPTPPGGQRAPPASTSRRSRRSAHA